MHNRYFEEFAKLIQSVEAAMTLLATQADEIKRLMGVYPRRIAEPQITRSFVSIFFLSPPSRTFSGMTGGISVHLWDGQIERP